MRAAVPASASARPGWCSTATTAPRSSISAARWVVLAPGAAQRSSTRSPGRGPSTRETAIAARDWLADRGMGGDAVQEGELEGTQAQRRQHGRLEPLDRPPGEVGDQVVERL